ncbi:MAG: hypothetical protein OXF02_07705 [Simkaniaceae bacterium]|nr:hypothetical protein [Simkaniaceae bacterium]
MIISLKKYLFVGVRADLDRFFTVAQREGFIEFTSEKRSRNSPLSEREHKLVKALRVLAKFSPSGKKVLESELDPVEVADTLIAKAERRESLTEELRLLDAELNLLLPLGSFSVEDIMAIEKEGKRYVRFFCTGKSRKKKVRHIDELIRINTVYDVEYYMSIDDEKKRYSGMHEIRVDRSPDEVKKRIAEVRTEIGTLERELKKEQVYDSFLRKALMEEHNLSSLNMVKEETQSHMEERLFSATGWVPANKVDALHALPEGMAVHIEEVIVREGERVPTHMENTGSARVGEDLVRIYDVPANHDADPSPWVFWSFAVFYAMIISDAGYGMLYLLALSVFRKIGKSPVMKRMFRLGTVLAVGVVVWGVLAGSYFGLHMAPSNPLHKVALMHGLSVQKGHYLLEHREGEYHEWVEKFPFLKEASSGEEVIEKGFVTDKMTGAKTYVIYEELRNDLFMEIAILVGILHLFLAFFRYARRHPEGVGHALAMAGGYLYFPKFLGATSIVHFCFGLSKQTAFTIGLQLLCGGLLLACITGCIRHGWKGFAEIMKPLEVFADVLSYLRLYALGIAGIILAETFNSLGARVGFVGGFLIVLLGQAMNIAVGVMGGVIHGLRLNFIEWYHHCFEGGGKLFHPLKLLKTQGE